MKKSIIAAGFAATLVVTACGSSGGSSDQEAVAGVLIASAKKDGIDADEACVKEVAGKLSDDDAKKLLALGDDGDIDAAGLSPEGYSTAAGILNCVDVSTFIDEAIDSLNAQGLPFDEQCVRDAFDGVDFSQFATGGESPPGLQDALLGCVTLGS